MTHIITTDLFAAFLNCKYKAYLKATGITGSVSDYEIMETSVDEEYRMRASRHLLQAVPADCVVEAPKSTHRAIQQGFDAITNARVTAEGFSVRFDALLRSSVKATSGPNYLPILFSASERVSKQHKLLLTFQAVALTTILGHPPRYGRIMYGDAFHDVRVNIDRLRSTVEAHLDELREMIAPRFGLNDHCRVCEFGAHCQQLAFEKDDLSLLRRLSGKEISKLNNKGIFTTTQLSYTFRPRRRRKARKQRHIQHNHALQALAIRTDTIYVAQKPELPNALSLVYVDFEGVPNREFYYLIGVHVVTGRDQQFFSLWADTVGDEEKMWESFLGIIKGLGEFAILHYGAYDRRAFELLSQRYGGDEPLIQMVISSCTNVLSLIYGHVYFPTHSNDLKSVASCLSFQWSEADASGLQSLVWRHHWDTDRDKLSKDKLLTYNREDCLALRTVTDALSAISESRSGPGTEVPRETIDADQLARGWPRTYGRNEFFLPELDRVNRCAYFDYQRDRVFVRTSRNVRDAVRRKTRKPRRRVRVNRTIEHPRPSRCPRCLHTKVIRHESGRFKTIHDLKLIDGGIRRWVVKHLTHRYLCTNCRRTFMPPEYPSSSFGNTLRAWAVHQNVGLLRSNNSIIEDMRELFDYEYADSIAQRFKADAARYYEPTYRMLLERIRTGDLAHVDETKVSAKGESRYVWVFTNLDEVAYVYSDTRERATLDTVLDG